MIQGVDHFRSTSSESFPQSERDQTAPISLSEGEDPDAALFAILGPAAYLKLMMEKGRQESEAARASQPKPAAVHSPAPPPVVVAEAPPARTSEPTRPVRPTPPAGPSRTAQDDARPVVAGMVASLFKDAGKAAWGPAPGKPRHMTQAEQLAALAERKRRREREARNGPRASNRPSNGPNISTP